MSAPTIYLAARWSRWEEMNGYAARLLDARVLVTSTWHRDAPQYIAREAAGVAYSDVLARHIAERDLADLREAETLALFTPGGRRGGLYVELGIALERELQIIVIGPQTNVFTPTTLCRCDTGYRGVA